MKWDGMGWIGSDGGIKKRAEPSQSSAVQTTKGASFQWGSVPASQTEPVQSSGEWVRWPRRLCHNALYRPPYNQSYSYSDASLPFPKASLEATIHCFAERGLELFKLAFQTANPAPNLVCFFYKQLEVLPKDRTSSKPKISSGAWSYPSIYASTHLLSTLPTTYRHGGRGHDRCSFWIVCTSKEDRW